LAEVAARGGGIWASVLASRQSGDDDLRSRLAQGYRRVLAGGATTLEVKSGYGLTVDEELRELRLLEESRSRTPLQLVTTFLGAHVVPRDIGGESPSDAYTDLIIDEMLPAVAEQQIAQYHDVTVEDGHFTPSQALRLIEAGRAVGQRQYALHRHGHDHGGIPGHLDAGRGPLPRRERAGRDVPQ